MVWKCSGVVQVLEMFNRYTVIWKLGDNFQISSYRFNEAPQSTYIHIRTFFQLRNRSLPDVQNLSKLLL